MGLNFTAIDFETANARRASACAVGIAKVRDGRIVDQLSWLVRPAAEVAEFAAGNVAVHGIRPRDVRGAVGWSESHRKILEMAGSDPLVAFNSSFDASVFREASKLAGVSPEDWDWRCAWRLAKKHLELPKYDLPSVVRELKVRGLKHHDAGSDAVACANVVLAIARRESLHSVNELWPQLAQGKPKKSSSFAAGSIKKADLPLPNIDADPRHPLFGQHVTVTGEFQRYDRMEAFRLAADLGAAIELGTTLRTTMLVVADEDPRAPGFDLSRGSTKARKAHEYMTRRGQRIEILSAEEFYEVLEARVEKVEDQLPRELLIADTLPETSEPLQPKREQGPESIKVTSDVSARGVSEDVASEETPLVESWRVLPAEAIPSSVDQERFSKKETKDAQRLEKKNPRHAWPVVWRLLRVILAVILFLGAGLFLSVGIGLLATEVAASVFSFFLTLGCTVGGVLLMRRKKI
ncbi:exonuclease domain-containing protein [Glutamicibacter creatinolyticus]|uniref:exonuclease domain-containing protein n=1 Tax=Glutamicibacter creatinolyticus TaxID=162496 RepID=UPI0031D2C71F